MPVSKTQSAKVLGETAFRKLRMAILEGTLPPGTPLSRRRLAEELGMSSVPVADAIARLEGEGLVESKARAGTRVKIATADEIRGNYVLREALETHSARLFAECADARQRERLMRTAERLDRAYNALGRCKEYRQSRHAKVERIHIEFHMQIARATRVPLFADAIERSRVLLFNWIFTVARDFEKFPERWHRDLAEALAKGSAEEAATAMRSHVRFRQADVIERFQDLARRQEQDSRMVRGPRRRVEH
ncbi:MAG: GntR family transcriptional regulator [Acidobacteriota bacterium]